ncbi:hypothetical protein D1AOALGA4SA_11924 [Olavius algarvensis Delta 1 endosymbiont]|nr:hypothetical protein D1AOALGA4SA_11924 [Olavius algarvensis Delta 1 endosymbiont]
MTPALKFHPLEVDLTTGNIYEVRIVPYGAFSTDPVREAVDRYITAGKQGGWMDSSGISF